MELLLIAPWSVTPPAGGSAGQLPTRVNIANPVSYIVQKLQVSGKRKPSERAKDVLYIHGTFELFAGTLPDLRLLWTDAVRPALGPRTRRLHGRVSSEAA